MKMLVYQDTDIAVINKPIGMLSQPGENQAEPDAATALSQFLGKPVFPVHRLDRNTAGLVVYAKTKRAAARLSDAIRQNRLEKQYTALVCGVPDPQKGEYRDYLIHRSALNKSFPCPPTQPGAKEAVLTYEVIKTVTLPAGECAYVQITLQTGRTNQIRAQLAAHKHPLLGDTKYGGGSGSYQLTATKLSFPHPGDGIMVTFEVG